MEPICIKEYYIYDILHNDENKIVIISAAEIKPVTIKYKNSLFRFIKCPHNHTYVYVLDAEIKYEKKILLNIDGKNFHTNVNKYPNLQNKIIMSTMVKFDDNIIKQFIDFHYNIGVQHFIIYDNKHSSDMEKTSINGDAKRNVSNQSNLKLLLDEYIKKNIVVLLQWPYDKFMKKAGISGQTTQQTHSIWAFKNARYVGLLDIDEYVNLQKDTKICTFFNNVIKSNNLNYEHTGGFKLLNKFFYNPKNLPTDDFKFLTIFNCANSVTTRGNWKCFVNPKNVDTFSVHMITKGKRTYTISPNMAFFNHYYYLNKESRGRNRTNATDNSIVKHLTFLESSKK